MKKQGPEKNKIYEKPLVVLLIDSNINLKSSVESLITSWMGKDDKRYGYAGHRVSYASTPEEGLEAARRENPDLVILDPELNMVGIKKFLTPFRKENSRSVVYCWSNGDYKEQSEKAGADKFVKKGLLGLYHAIMNHEGIFSRENL